MRLEGERVIIKTFNIEPMGKPAIQRGIKRKANFKFDAWREEIKYYNGFFKLPKGGFHLLFYFTMPKSWSNKRKTENLNKPHFQKPDADNCCKAFFDSLYPDNDSFFWDYRVTKLWAEKGRIEIRKL